MIQAFNPKIKFTGSENLMKGDDACIERFIWKGWPSLELTDNARVILNVPTGGKLPV
jgi:hypothetical protein